MVSLPARSKSLRTSKVMYLRSHLNCLTRMDLQRGRFPSKPFPFSGGGTSLRLSHFRLEYGLLMLSRVQNLKHNFAIVDALTEIATRKGITPAQLSIAWVSARGPHVVPLPGSSCVLISPLMPRHSRKRKKCEADTREHCRGECRSLQR